MDLKFKHGARLARSSSLWMPTKGIVKCTSQYGIERKCVPLPLVSVHSFWHYEEDWKAKVETLTFRVRKRVLALLKELEHSTALSDEAIAVAVGEKLLRYPLSGGIEHALTREAVGLSYQLVFGSNEHRHREVRTALLYLLQEMDAVPDADFSRGLDDDMYVLHRASQLICAAAEKSGDPDPLMKLSNAHTKEVETRLEQFAADQAQMESVAERARQQIAAMRQRVPSSLVDELSGNVEWLLKATERKGDLEAQSWSMAALQFVAAGLGVIPDQLGPIGILDDLHATYVALRMFDAPRAAIVAALGAARRALPLADLLILRSGDSRYPLSEYCQLNFAVTIGMLGKPHAEALLLRVPATGNIGLLVAFLVGMATLYRDREKLTALPQFDDGELVQVTQGDQVAVGYFGGFEERGGVRGLALSGGGKRCWITLSPELLASITLAQNRKPKGLEAISAHADDQPVAVLDFLFDSKLPLRLDRVGCRVLVVVNSLADARAFTEDTRLLGASLAEVMPIGRLMENDSGPPEGWSKRWEATPPILACTYSLFEACEFLEDQQRSKTCELVILQDAGHWANASDLLSRISKAGRPVVALAAFADDEKAAAFANSGFMRAGWDVEEIEQLSWPHTSSAGGGLNADEQRVRRAARATVEALTIAPALVDDLCEQLEAAQASFENQHLQSASTDAVFSHTWKAFTAACRWPLPFYCDDPALIDLEQASRGLNNAAQNRALSESCSRQIQKAAESLSALAKELRASNPKWFELEKILQVTPNVNFIARDSVAADQLRAAKATGASAGLLRGVHIESEDGLGVAGLPTGSVAVVPGWYRAVKMSRLLNPPIADKVIVLLWTFEARKFKHWDDRRLRLSELPSITDKSGSRFRRRVGRIAASNAVEARDLGPDDLVHVLEHRAALGQARLLTGTARATRDAEDIVDARLVSFVGGGYAFLSADGNVADVTDLLRGNWATPSVERRATIATSEVCELETGRLLLFHTGTESDAIRAQADDLLNAEKPGSAAKLRQFAELWRTALRSYCHRNALRPAELAKQLAAAGCKRDILTVRQWLNDDLLIAPRSYERDLDAVLKMTGDAALASGLKLCIGAISELRSAHLRSSKALAERLLDRGKRGTAGKQVTGDYGAGLVVREVNMVDPDVHQVPRHILRKVFDSNDQARSR